MNAICVVRMFRSFDMAQVARSRCRGEIRRKKTALYDQPVNRLRGRREDVSVPLGLV